ncbi:HTH-type transcriptional repressor YvoA [Clostridium magnum DSM 2767]|uniref:HTH-type transcriptional repressor YvoA n=1 Tax=Clostridium magnum DSM 2767 TaxID=1121326 RepID=A0A162QV38_9CLOT|nr:GntR family transcriptional regulator [Clostridium magnum]KZL89007.1 HTH-type transcriptional repressor YvoA [Clostridium magnum DSM 2767]SHI23340.1 GntR family transcriptional regulator [Clostridium magnum DSM 2767]
MLKSDEVIPLYEQLMNKLKNEIAAGVYKQGEKLPSEIEMAKGNNVSVVTARKAMDELAAIGIVEKRRGKGTFVARSKYKRDYTRIRGFSESCIDIGLTPGTKLLEQKLAKPKQEILDMLRLPMNSQTVFISRLRYVNGEPMIIEDSYFSLDYAFLLNEPLDKSLFAVLKEKRDIDIAISRKVIEICRAGTKESRLLNVRKNHPLLLTNSTAFTADETPIYVCSQIINGERFKLHV